MCNFQSTFDNGATITIAIFEEAASRGPMGRASGQFANHFNCQTAEMQCLDDVRHKEEIVNCGRRMEGRAVRPPEQQS